MYQIVVEDGAVVKSRDCTQWYTVLVMELSRLLDLKRNVM